ncbi:hypothetical protein KR026_006203, partial [Drosophila bipectinata]
VPTSLNRADILSRDALPNELVENKLWSRGPPFLIGSQEAWPTSVSSERSTLELRARALLIQSPYVDITAVSKYAISFPALQMVSSALASSSPFVDKFGLLRVDGRINNSSLDFDSQHPIILPRSHPVVNSSVVGAHSDLPEQRVSGSQFFGVTGVDICGPFYYKPEVRNKAPVNCYVSVFICFATKAVHLELVRDLSTISFLQALKRF